MKSKFYFIKALVALWYVIYGLLCGYILAAACIATTEWLLHDVPASVIIGFTCIGLLWSFLIMFIKFSDFKKVTENIHVLGWWYISPNIAIVLALSLLGGLIAVFTVLAQRMFY